MARLYKADPLDGEMLRVMSDWHDGRDTIFYKVSIGDENGKRLKPCVRKHFAKISREAQGCLGEMTDQTAAEAPADVEALHSIMSWSRAQIKRMEGEERLDAAVRSLADAGVTLNDIQEYVATSFEMAAMPTD